MIMIGIKCELAIRATVQYKSFIKSDVSASICSNVNSSLNLLFHEILNCIVH